MAMMCYICGKRALFGSSQKHRRGVAGKRWKNRVTPTPRLFKPNLQVAKIELEDREVRVKVCAKCLKRIKKNKAEAFMQN